MKKLKNYKVAVIDIETTGIVPSQDSILEIGIVELDLINGTTNILFFTSEILTPLLLNINM